MRTKKLATAIVSGVIAASVTMISTNTLAAATMSANQEKCYGITKAGHNDCGGKNTGHSCQGQAKKNNDPYDFKIVPKGTCDKMGGSLTAGQKK